MSGAAPDDALAPAGEEGAGLSGRAARGAGWTGAAAVVGQVSQLASTIVLARLLTPRDYGLTTVVWVVVSVATIFTELGINAALVQKRDLRDDDLDAGFWANAASGLALTASVAALAPLLARLYGKPELTGLLLVASLSFTVNAAVVPKALLERDLRFRKLAVLESVARVAGWAAAIGFAVGGMGAASLVLGPLVGFALNTVLLFAFVRWRPHGFGTAAAYRHLWRFGRGSTGFHLTTVVAHQADSLLVPLVEPARTVGLYNRAYNLMTLPVHQIGGTVARVLLPALSGIQDDGPRLRAAVRRAVLMTSVVGFPVAAGIGVTAPILIPAMFGDQWEEAVPLVRVLSIASLPQIALLPLSAVYSALGETGKLFRFGVVQSVLSVLAVLLGLPWGVDGVVIAIVLRHWLGIPLSFGPPLRLLGEPVWSMLRPLAGPTCSCLVMVGAVLLVDGLLDLHGLAVRLGVQTAVGATTYVGMLRLTSRGAWEEGRRLLGRRAT